jgi:hypothetical protein
MFFSDYSSRRITGILVQRLQRRGCLSASLHDPFGAAQDKELSLLALALDPEHAGKQFKRRLPRLSGAGRLKLRAIRVTRHKPGRRCVVEYDVEVRTTERPQSLVTLIGKTRSKRSGNEAFRLQDSFWEAGFQADSSDLISVPEPIGVIAAFQMWFQRKVSGQTSDQLLRGSQGIKWARRIAELSHKVHRAAIPAEKKFGIADELAILEKCLQQVASLRPVWSARLSDLMKNCQRLAEQLPAPRTSGIHRDFYSSQVIVDGERLWVIDFDLYCEGDPALDAGNFLGHITEQALRELGDARAFQSVERAFTDRFVELAGDSVKSAVDVYANLTLARHIFLSTKFPERQALTESLLGLCEQRIQQYHAVPSPA